jgi:hypothetical protein
MGTSPFQLELAFYSLGVGIAALIVHGDRAGVRGKVALVLGFATISYGNACGHIYQIIAHHDHAVNNSGLLLVSDFVIPTVGIAFLAWNLIARRINAGNRVSRTLEVSEPVPVMQPAR